MTGRLNMAIAANILAALGCLVIWLPARSFAVLAIFSIMQGVFGGVIFYVVAPAAISVVGTIHIGSALVIFWLVMMLSATFPSPLPAAVALVDYPCHTWNRDGPIIICGASFASSAAMFCRGKVAIQAHFKNFKKT